MLETALGQVWRFLAFTLPVVQPITSFNTYLQSSNSEMDTKTV